MALNPQYEDIGKGFVQQYYSLFDDPANRASVVNFYSVSSVHGLLSNSLLCVVIIPPDFGRFNLHHRNRR